MRSLSRLALVFALPLAGCHPYSCWWPPELPAGEPASEMASADSRFPVNPVEVVVDDKGVPHIYGESDVDIAYAQGFFHGKDRQFQMLSFKLALFGRLAEMLGEGSVDSDQAARLITYGVDEQVADMDPREYDLLEAYSAGVNAGVAYAGPTQEMMVIGTLYGTVEWQKWEPRDCLAITRFFAWDLSNAGLYGEMARQRIINRIEPDDPRYDELMRTVWTADVPVVRDEEHSGERDYPYPWKAGGGELPPAPRPVAHRVPLNHPSAGMKPSKAFALGNPFEEALSVVSDEGGASNVWAVSGDLTSTGNAVHAHDPHLAHRDPGLFYLVHLEGPDYTLAGASVGGAPGVLLGHGRHVSWGTPVSNADTMDTVRITEVPGREGEAYYLDGEEVEYEKLTQVYKLGFEDDAETVEETWLITEFGPVLPPAWQWMHDEGEVYALMWPGHRPINSAGSLITSLWDLGKSDNVEDATAAIQRLTSPAITMGMAFSDGTIAYRISGDIPLRWSAEPVWLPRDGTSRQAGWAGRLPPEYKPQLENPARGFYVAANQRIVEQGGPAWEVIGVEGSHPWRAKRITERIEELVADGAATPEDIWAVQQESQSYLSRELAPILGGHCPGSIEGHEAATVQAFCDRIAGFDGTYTVDTEGAYPFERLLDETFRLILVTHLGEDVADQVGGEEFTATNLFRLVLASAEGEEPALFDDPETADYDGLGSFVARAAKPALDKVVEAAGQDPSGWRWGNWHYQTIRGALAGSIPLVGGAMFEGGRIEEPGCGSCPRAERSSLDSGRIGGGAVLRVMGHMTEPAEVGVINDLGQSGNFGHWSYGIAYDRWSAGEFNDLVMDKDEAGAVASGRVRFMPEGSGE